MVSSELSTPKLTIVVGLPGAGKTQLVKSFKGVAEGFRDACMEGKDLAENWIFFEKDIGACLHNLTYDVAYSDREDVRRRARSFFDCVEAYELPPPAEYPSERIRKVGRADVVSRRR